VVGLHTWPYEHVVLGLLRSGYGREGGITSTRIHCTICHSAPVLRALTMLDSGRR
jgi:hypothetical protein